MIFRVLHFPTIHIHQVSLNHGGMIPRRRCTPYIKCSCRRFADLQRHMTMMYSTTSRKRCYWTRRLFDDAR